MILFGKVSSILFIPAPFTFFLKDACKSQNLEMIVACVYASRD